MTCEFPLAEQMKETVKIKHFPNLKKDDIIHIMIRWRINGYHCKSGMSLSLKLFNCNYNDSPLKKQNQKIKINLIKFKFESTENETEELSVGFMICTKDSEPVDQGSKVVFVLKTLSL